MDISNNQSWYVNPNIRQVTSNKKNTVIKDREAFNGSMQNLLNPTENLAQVLRTPIKLAEKSSLNRQSNTINIASGMRIAVNDGHVLTVKQQGVEVSGGNNPYDTESYLKAHRMADSLATLLHNACGVMKTVAYSQEEYARWTEGFSSTLSQLAMEQDFATGGNDDIFGSDLESNIEAVRKIADRLQNPLHAVSERNAEFVANEKKFYTALLSNLK